MANKPQKQQSTQSSGAGNDCVFQEGLSSTHCQELNGSYPPALDEQSSEGPQGLEMPLSFLRCAQFVSIKTRLKSDQPSCLNPLASLLWPPENYQPGMGLKVLLLSFV